MTVNMAALLKRRDKEDTPQDLQAVDRAGEEHGFVDRSPRKKPGRKAGPRQSQLHPKMKQEYADAIIAEADELGITQGHLIEKLWDAYAKAKAK